jgi:hypothetical protein
VTEPWESLTLDIEAHARAAAALSDAFEQGHQTHWCAEWEEGDGCTICWDIAADILRAAEGLRKCSRCRGGGMVAPGAECPECAGTGVEAVAA